MYNENGKITWMQLSDLHIFESTEWNLSKNKYKQLKKKHKINFIIVTGDLHQYNTNYHKTGKFLNELECALGLSKTDIFMIPGNHDSDYFKDKEVYISYIDSQIINNKDAYYKYIKTLQGSFLEYNKFVNEFYGSSDVRTYHYPETVSVKVWEDKINLLHFNTALICDGNNERKQIVDIRRLSEMKIDNGLPIIAIAHHDFHDLHDGHCSVLKRFFTDNKVSVYLHGDVHKTATSLIHLHDTSSSSIPSISCGKSSVETNDNFSDVGFNVYEWDEKNDQVNVIPYCWNKTNYSFIPTFKLDSDSGCYSFIMRKLIDNQNKKF